MPSTKKNMRKLKNNSKNNSKKNKKMKSLKKGGMWPFDKDDTTDGFSILDFFKTKTPEQKIEEIKKKKEKCIEKADKEIQEIQDKSKETVASPQPVPLPVPVPVPENNNSVSESILPPSLSSVPPSASESESYIPPEPFQKKGGRRRICKKTYRKK